MARTPSTATAAPHELTPQQLAAVGRLTRDLPAPRPVSPGEVSGLGHEALQGYARGESIRYDTQGREWTYRRTVESDQFFMTVAVTFFGVPLCDGRIRLDRIAGKDGEDELLALVERLALEVFDVQAACVKAQKAAQSEADEAVAPLIERPPVAEDPATSPDPVLRPDEAPMPRDGVLAEVAAEPPPKPPAPEPEKTAREEAHERQHQREPERRGPGRPKHWPR